MKAPMNMTFSDHCADKMKRRGFAERSAFTLAELVVAMGAATIVLGCAVGFFFFARISASGIMAQTRVSDQSAHALVYMQSRIRVASSVAVDSTGNTLTLGFDDNPLVDSDGDGITWNDKDHYETFQFHGTNGTNSATAASNTLIYTPKVGVNGSVVLVSAGVRNLPGNNIFALDSNNAVVINFGVVDTNTRDRFQAIEIQGRAVPINVAAQ